MSSDADTSKEISPDLVFELLSSSRRRMVLYYLRQKDGTATVNELAEEVAAMENEVDVEDLTRRQQKRVYVSLYQTHLPKLKEANIIEYDSDEGEVRLTDRAQEIDGFLTPATESTYPWPIHYFALAAAGLIILGLSILGIPGLAAIPLLWFGFLLAGVFALSAVAQYRSHRQRQESLPVELSRRD